jgi:L-alanine-DL-glutamate epimerase-like enolase superfamily enzyme
MILQEVTLRRVRLPLIQPYVLSYRTFDEFEPIIVEVRDSDGTIGWGEGHISPGSSSETPEGGWTFCREQAAAIVGRAPKTPKRASPRKPEPAKSPPLPC